MGDASGGLGIVWGIWRVVRRDMGLGDAGVVWGDMRGGVRP